MITWKNWPHGERIFVIIEPSGSIIDKAERCDGGRIGKACDQRRLLSRLWKGLFTVVATWILSGFLSPPALVRAQNHPKIGLALGGGGAKGLAHIPVLKLLDELDIPIDYIAGTSVGGILGGLYAIGYSGVELEELSESLDWDMLFRDWPPRSQRPYFNKKHDGKFQLDMDWDGWLPSPPQGLLYGQNISLMLQRLTYPWETIRDFDELPVPFRCVAVDLLTSQPVIIEDGSLARAMRATMAIPTMFSPVERSQDLLIDGGVLNNLPVDVVRDMGAEIVIAVDLSSPLRERDELDSADNVLSQSLLLVEIQHGQKNAALADFLIHPDLKDLGSMDFFSPEKLERIKVQGEHAAQAARPRLLKLKQRYGLARNPKKEGEDSVPRNQKQSPPASYIIGEIEVRGNQRLSAAFILDQIPIQTGMRVRAGFLETAVCHLYALGYFMTIHYELFPLSGDRVRLELHVKERPPGRFRLGLRYDNLHKLVAVTGMDFSNVILPGLRIENELQLIGVTRFRSRLYYPSRTLNLPIYPITQIGYRNFSARLFDGQGDRIASYNDRAWNLDVGLGLLWAKWFNAEFLYRNEYMDIKRTSTLPPEDWIFGLNDRLQQLIIEFSVDAWDDGLLPQQGLRLKARYEGSYRRFNSEPAYEKWEASGDGYITFGGRHTGRLYAFLGRSRDELPFYKYFNQGRQQFFVGMRYDQLFGSRMNILRGEYRYRLNNYLLFSCMINAAFDVRQQGRPEIEPARLWGFGLGVVVDSPAGTMEAVYSIGSQSLSEPKKAQSVIFLALGTRF
jgi:NTE family protein